MTTFAKKSDIVAILKERLSGVIVIAGIGNTLRSDDAAGPRLVEILKERFHKAARPPPSVHLFNCHETPENYINSIVRVRPDTVVVVDSASLGLPAGETRIIEADDLHQQTSSTHCISPALLMNRLKEETGADVFMLALQPATTALGEGFSTPVRSVVTNLADLIASIIRRK